MRHDAANSSDCLWQILEEHFQYHSRLVDHFRSADASAVAAMWNSGANAAGEQLSQFEYEALVERYCELFGNWPKHPQRVGRAKRIIFGSQSVVYRNGIGAVGLGS